MYQQRFQERVRIWASLLKLSPHLHYLKTSWTENRNQNQTIKIKSMIIIRKRQSLTNQGTNWRSKDSTIIHLAYADNLLRLNLAINLATTENIARPPLIPTPIVKPLAEAVTILHSFSESWIRIEFERIEEQEEGSDPPQCGQWGSSGSEPPFSQEKHAHLPPAPSPDGDMGEN